MGDTNPTFLTEIQFDKNLLLTTLKEHKSLLKQKSEQDILDIIIRNFEKKNFELITSQEISFLNNHEKDIWADYLIFRYKFRNFPKNHILADYPVHLSVEPVSACNLRCTMCFQSDESFSSNKDFMGTMDLDLFKKIIDEASNGSVGALTLASRGEPTMNSNLDKMLEYIPKKFFEVKLNTNATLLNDKLIHSILDSNVTDMVFSIDSYNKENYEKIRLRGIFEEVFENIKKFYQIKKEEYPNSLCTTRVSGVRVDENQDPIMFEKFWEKYVDYVVMVNMEPWWDTYNNSTDIASVDSCVYLWQKMNVWYDGKCNPCDIDYKSELSMGNLKENSINEIWTSNAYNELRLAHTNNQRNQYSPCDRCPIGCS